MFQKSEILKNAVSERWCADSTCLFKDSTEGLEGKDRTPDPWFERPVHVQSETTEASTNTSKLQKFAMTFN